MSQPVDPQVIVESATTHAVAPGERTEYWSEVINSFQRRLGYSFAQSGDFRGHATRRSSANYNLVRWHSDAVTYHYTAEHMRAEPDGDYRLLLPMTGPNGLRQGEEALRLPPGSGYLVTLDQPCAVAQGDRTEGMLMTIPRREIDHRLGRTAPANRPLDLTSGLGRVVSDMATGLFDEGDVLSSRQFDAVAERLVDLFCMLVLGDRPTGPSHLADVATVVRQHIRTHAGDPELSGAAVAHALGWSLRQVQLALHQVGLTPREVIKEERLQLAQARLRDPVYHGSSIADLALGLGFSSASAFSTAFRQRFGASPRDIRYG